MEDLRFIQKATYEYAESLARKFYKNKLLGKSVKSKILRCRVKFTGSGWNHFVDKDRSINELITRFFALPMAKTVLKASIKLADYEKRKVGGGWNEYWVVEHVVENIVIKVVVCSINKGARFFLSCVWKGGI